MLEVDIRESGSGCVDNPVLLLAEYLSRGIPIRVIMRRDQENLVRDLLDVAEYKVVSQSRKEGLVIIEAVKEE